MYSIKFLLPIAFIALVNGASFSKRQEIQFEDGTSTGLVGDWIIHGIQGGGPENQRIKCYCANVTQKGSHYLVDKNIITKKGEKVSALFGGVENDELGSSITFYKLNADGSRGATICDVTGSIAGHIVKYASLQTCNFDNFVSYKAICISKNKKLSSEDKQALDELCPPNSSQQLQTNC